MTLRTGDRIPKNKLEEELDRNSRRILNLQLFSSVHYAVNETINDSIDIHFNLQEMVYWIPRPMLTLADRNINVWWKEQEHALDRINLGLELTRLNFRGRNERIGGTVQVGYNKFFDFFYKIPYFDRRLKRGAGISFTYFTGKETAYRVKGNKLLFFRSEENPYQGFQTELTYTYRPAYAITHEGNISYNHYSITDSLYQLNRLLLAGRKKLNYVELKYTVGFNNTDIRIYPLNGLDARIYLSSKNGLGADRSLHQHMLRAECSYYKRLNHFFSTSFVFRGRVATTLQQTFLFSRALGFKNEYLRGYEYYVIDGTHYALFRGNLRMRIIDRTIKQNWIGIFRFLPIRCYAKLFDDLGYVVAGNFQESRSLNNRWLNGFGAGIDIILSYYARFRIEYSFNHLHQNGLFLHGNKE